MNDTQRKQVEAVRERLKEIINTVARRAVEICPATPNENYYINQILNGPAIAILDEKQNLPAYYARNNIYRIIPPDKKSQKDGGE